MAMNRRRFLLLGGGIGGLLLAMPDRTRLRSIWQDPEETLRSRLIGLFNHQHSARMIGQTYLQRYPQDVDGRVLLTKVVADTVRFAAPSHISGKASSYASDWLGNVSDHDLLDLLRGRIRQDFGEEKVVKLRGWILSATEARLCALTALA